MQLEDIKLFIFDWDGTLSTSTALVRFSRFFKTRYSPKYILEHSYLFKSRPDLGHADISLMHEEEEKNLLYAKLYEIYALFTRPKLREGAVELLSLLKKEGKKTAVFTDAKRYRTIREIRMNGISKKIDYLLSADSIGAYKPNPTGLEIIVREARVSKRSSVYVGDMASDIFTAKFAGVHSCAVGGGMNSINALKDAKPDFVFSSTEEMARYFAER
jgi:FMN phosphatase YigB (HAD superfamily)